MKNLFKILILSLFTFSFCCGPEDVVKEEGNYKDGNKDGEWISYCEHGNIIEEGNYKDGKKYGKWISYLEDGQIWYEGNYHEGKKDGKFIKGTNLDASVVLPAPGNPIIKIFLNFFIKLI